MALIINGERVEDAEIEAVGRQLEGQRVSSVDVPEWEAKGKDLDTFAKDMVIARVLIRQEAKGRKDEILAKTVVRELEHLKRDHGGPEEFQRYLDEAELGEDQVKQEIELGLRIDAVLNEVCEKVPEPSEEEIKAHYEAHKDEFKSPEQVRVAHIVKHVEGTVLDLQAAHAEMKEALQALKHGVSFEVLARRYSDCPERGGDLGYFARGTMVAEFEDVVFALETGAITGIFETPFGLHIAKLYDRVPPKERAFEEAREDLKDTLYNERENAAIDAFTDALRAQAMIEEA